MSGNDVNRGHRVSFNFWELTSDFIQVDIDVHGESDWEPFSGNTECVNMIQSMKRKKRNILRAATYLNLQGVNYTVSDLEVIDF